MDIMEYKVYMHKYSTGDTLDHLTDDEYRDYIIKKNSVEVEEEIYKDYPIVTLKEFEREFNNNCFSPENYSIRILEVKIWY